MLLPVPEAIGGDPSPVWGWVSGFAAQGLVLKGVEVHGLQWFRPSLCLVLVSSLRLSGGFGPVVQNFRFAGQG